MSNRLRVKNIRFERSESNAGALTWIERKGTAGRDPVMDSIDGRSFHYQRADNYALARHDAANVRHGCVLRVARRTRGDQQVFANTNMAACTVLLVLTLYVIEVAPNQHHDADAKERRQLAYGVGLGRNGKPE